ncbi:MAG: sporulation protein [Oscillospiraceae bacterium]|nr:sporulation protein [Oscillospiraceae bacterium]
MAYTQEDKSLELPHRLVLEGRGKLTITGITEIESFDENTIVLYTTRGTLVIHGRQLHLSMLSVDGGQANVDGTIDSMVYEDEKPVSGSFLSRLFG